MKKIFLLILVLLFVSCNNFETYNNREIKAKGIQIIDGHVYLPDGYDGSRYVHDVRCPKCVQLGINTKNQKYY